jgi:hypothetical protein
MLLAHFFERNAGPRINAVLNHCFEQRFTNFRVPIEFQCVLKRDVCCLPCVLEYAGALSKIGRMISVSETAYSVIPRSLSISVAFTMCVLPCFLSAGTSRLSPVTRYSAAPASAIANKKLSPGSRERLITGSLSNTILEARSWLYRAPAALGSMSAFTRA